jgi:calcineurin-like phosphoesterase family protein
MTVLPASFRVRALGLIAAAVLVFGVLPMASAYTSHSSDAGPTPWSFGIMADTQWTPFDLAANKPIDPAGANANRVADSIIDQINAQFIERGVKFVVETGDLSDQGDTANIIARGAAAQDLYNAGIGFFPIRGNHELNARPIGSNGYGTGPFRSTFKQTQGLGDYVFGATNFSSPKLTASTPTGVWPDDLKGLSYSFDYGDPDNDVRIVIIDPWVTPKKPQTLINSMRYGYTIADQQAWIDERIDKDTRDSEHVFVFSHENLMGQNHPDTLFTGYPDGRIADQNAFYASLQANDVRYTIGGHDHLNQRAIETSPDGKSRVHELIAASDSSKFYSPSPLNRPEFGGQKVRETSIAQDLYRIGFYIVTIAGDQVTFDYYANDEQFGSDLCWPRGTRGDEDICKAAGSVPGSLMTPEMNFVKRDSWGYDASTDPRDEYLFGGGASNGAGTTHGTDYSVINESYEGTTASVLSGSYEDATKTDVNGRPVVQAVDYGWTEAWSKGNHKGLASDIFTLWGMSPVGGETQGKEGGKTATFTLQMSYDPGSTTSLGNGAFGMATRTSHGTWVNAVDLNYGGDKSFVLGPWDAGYGLGTYGVDPSAKTVWAVVNHDGAFVAANDIEPVPGQVEPEASEVAQP